MRRDWIILLVLGALTLGLYYPVVNFAFINYDDTLYVTANEQVQAGLTWAGLKWAFGRFVGEETYWHPLTWLSHMLDCQLFGLKAGWHHLVNVLLHAGNAALLFLVWRRMTGAFWRCAVLAALFALHPLQVDTVAWVAERKNVLSTCFWLLTMGAYGLYVKESKAQSLKSKVWYGLALVGFALGLMCKPALVTLPFVLLLLDYWPMGRLSLAPLAQGESARKGKGVVTVSPANLGRRTARDGPAGLVGLVVEKLPFFALTAVSCLITLAAHRSLRGLSTQLPLGLRLENAVVSYGRYLAKTFWPSHLSFFYPYPKAWPLWEVALGAVLLLGVSGLALRLARNHPWFLVGWCWFLGVLVPFIGVVQAGGQAMADRFAYVPLIGLLMMVIWGAQELTAGWRHRDGALSAGALAATLCWLALSRQQIGYWRDSYSLFAHALAVTEDNYVAHNNLGNVLSRAGQHAAAKWHYQETLRLRPDRAETHYNLANVLAREGDVDAALRHYRAAVTLKPGYADAQYNLGVLLAGQGQTAEAIEHQRSAIRCRPTFAEAHNCLGNLLFKQGQVTEAIAAYRAALQVRPGYLDALLNLPTALKQAGREQEAIPYLAQAARLHPDSARAHSDLAIALARQRQFPEAERHFAEVVRLEPRNADAHYNLGNVLLDQGNIAEAAAQYAETVRLNPGDAKARQKLERTTAELDRAGGQTPPNPPPAAPRP